MKELFPKSNLNLLWNSLRLLSLILSLFPWEKIPVPTWIQAPVREFWRVRMSPMIYCYNWNSYTDQDCWRWNSCQLQWEKLGFKEKSLSRGWENETSKWVLNICALLFRNIFLLPRLFLFPSNIYVHKFLIHVQPDPPWVSLCETGIPISAQIKQKWELNSSFLQFVEYFKLGLSNWQWLSSCQLIQLKVLSWPRLLEMKFLPVPVGKTGI